jgi:hypothetical protein
MLQWLSSAAGVDKPISLNQPLSADYLNVYTTTPSSFAFTKTEKGNARYDPSLDAIFIDISFWKEYLFRSSIEVIYEESDEESNELEINKFPYLRIFFQFIFLHELGHRQLHGKEHKTNLFINSTDTEDAFEMENEADEFAIKAMKKAYSQTKVQPGYQTIGDSTAEVFQLGDEEISETTRIWIDLVAAITARCLFSPVYSNPYIPFFSDESHPMFLIRALRIVNRAVKNTKISEKIRARFQLVQKMLLRQKQSLELVSSLVSLPVPIHEVTFNDRELIISSIEMTSIYKVSLTSFSDTNTKNRQIKPIIIPPQKKWTKIKQYKIGLKQLSGALPILESFALRKMETHTS